MIYLLNDSDDSYRRFYPFTTALIAWRILMDIYFFAHDLGMYDIADVLWYFAWQEPLRTMFFVSRRW